MGHLQKKKDNCVLANLSCELFNSASLLTNSSRHMVMERKRKIKVAFSTEVHPKFFVCFLRENSKFLRGNANFCG